MARIEEGKGPFINGAGPIFHSIDEMLLDRFMGEQILAATGFRVIPGENLNSSQEHLLQEVRQSVARRVLDHNDATTVFNRDFSSLESVYGKREVFNSNLVVQSLRLNYDRFVPTLISKVNNGFGHLLATNSALPADLQDQHQDEAGKMKPYQVK